MIEGVVVHEVAGGCSELWARCHNCHKDTLVLTNVNGGTKGQPFCMCITCGEELFEDSRRANLVEVVSKHSWSGAVQWLSALQKPGG